ncbi:DUF2515 family protein [Paenibacillus senegalensis]|uniref:DUF2515 family protein n=1 Tax=Paenibacillus senegalensis TaxID=1465766 RepID=UPI0002892F0B|nr:DUF2515 family protein [Paenibacillus senegalensis]
MSRTSQKAVTESKWVRRAALLFVLVRSIYRTLGNVVLRNSSQHSLRSKLFPSGKEMEISNLDRRIIRKPLADQLTISASLTDAEGAESRALLQTSPAIPFDRLTAEELQWVETIREHTETANRNNLTRTQAYLDIYLKHPELHWAFLAHMVSRNGGWNMTDLRGDLLSRLLDKEQIEALFALLEKANALIFQDAYPQLLLYAESKRQGKPLFALLPHFGVSRFMLPLWEQFWKEGHEPLLAIGLIINEQQYIQRRVVENKELQSKAYPHSWERIMQAALQLNQIVFPWLPESAKETLRPLSAANHPAPTTQLFGRVLENFSDLQERIEFGKQLYALLFADPARHRGFLRFAQAVPHSGSRADYWPHVFTAAPAHAADAQARGAVRPAEPQHAGAQAGAHAAEPTRAAQAGAQQRSSLAAGDGRDAAHAAAQRHASPALGDAWPDRTLGEVERYDWFGDLSAIAYLTTAKLAEPVDITREHSACWRKLELAAAARELAAE